MGRPGEIRTPEDRKITPPDAIPVGSSEPPRSKVGERASATAISIISAAGPRPPRAEPPGTGVPQLSILIVDTQLDDWRPELARSVDRHGASEEPEVGVAHPTRPYPSLFDSLGQNGPHGAAKQAGVRQGDIVVAFDGKTDLRRETDLLAYAITAHQPGDKVEVTVQRDGQKTNLVLPMQE